MWVLHPFARFNNGLRIGHSVPGYYPARIPIRYCIGRISLTQMIPRLETHKADDPTGVIAAHGESRNEKRQKSSARHGRQCLVQFAEQLMGCET